MVRSAWRRVHAADSLMVSCKAYHAPRYHRDAVRDGWMLALAVDMRLPESQRWKAAVNSPTL